MIPRKLTTILAADVVGYSRLMAADEEGALRRLHTCREIFAALIGRHQGRIVNTVGDAVLADFVSAVEAVRCAIAIQEELAARNAELPADRQMLFRIGINVGDVMVEGDSLFGDGVNVAARLEGIAPPGGICISGSAFEQVKNKLSIGFEDIGPQQVKNIPYPVAAFRIRSGPVAVISETPAARREAGAGAPGGRRGRRRVALAGGGLFLVLVVGGVGLWRLYPRGPVPLASLPARLSTDEMRAAEIKAFMAGMTIQGLRTLDGQPFTITLNTDGTADYRFGRTGALSGTVQRETGRWRTEDFTFCMQFRRFHGGVEACPRVIREGQKIYATTPNGVRLAWTLSKD